MFWKHLSINKFSAIKSCGEKRLKVRECIIFLILSVSVVVFSSLLFRTLWIQTIEQKEFENMSRRIEQIRWDSQGKEEETFVEVLNNQEREEIQKIILPEYEELVQSNPDLAGWIRIKGTRIDYPVMQKIEDREYYLHRNFKKEKSFAGVPFVGSGDLTAENEDVFIYGHNMKNKTMFAELLNYQKQEFWVEYPTIQLDTLWKHQEYRIFTVFYTAEDEWSREDGLFYQAHKNLKTAREAFIKKLIEKGVYETWIVPKKDVPLVFLITCSYQEKNGRFVAVGEQMSTQ